MSQTQTSTALQASPSRHAVAEVAQAAQQQFLTFRLGTERFAISIQAIREIIEFPGMTSIPLTPAFLSGVINLRGAVVPVIDLSVRFGRAKTEVGRKTCIVIVEVAVEDGLQPLGVIVDAVDEVVEVDAALLLEVLPREVEQALDHAPAPHAGGHDGVEVLGGRAEGIRSLPQGRGQPQDGA